jgi:hypothetical protein
MSEVATDSRGICSNTDCPLSRGEGACIRGHSDPIDCELYQMTEAAALETERPPEPVPTIRIRSAEAMSIREAADVLGSGTTTVIVPLGHIEVGKTTLLSVIYEQAAADRLHEWSLAESRTILGFERRCHDSSVRSQRREPVTGRTQRDPEDLFLHLVLRRRDSIVRWQLLLADVSGEDVDALVRSQPPEGLLTLLRRADDIVVLVDASALVNPATRENEVRIALDLIRVLGDQRLARPRFTIAITKCDVLPDGSSEEMGSERILTAARTVLEAVNEVNVAARPAKDSPLPQGEGIDELLAALGPPRQETGPSTWPQIHVGGQQNPFWRFLRSKEID